MPIKSVLIIDDSEAEQFLYHHIFKNNDSKIKVTPAYNGQEAIDILNGQKHDVILLDINMPIMNGFEFLELHSKAQNNQPNVFVMLTESQVADKERALTYDCVKSTITKPISPEDIKLITETMDT